MWCEPLRVRRQKDGCSLCSVKAGGHAAPGCQLGGGRVQQSRWQAFSFRFSGFVSGPPPSTQLTSVWTKSGNNGADRVDGGRVKGAGWSGDLWKPLEPRVTWGEGDIWISLGSAVGVFVLVAGQF